MILLTGASGFIGNHLLEALAEKFGAGNLIVLTSKPIAGYRCILHDNYRFDKNIWEENKVDKIKTVIHAGAFTPKNGKEASNWKACTANITNTQFLLNHLPGGVEKMIFLSTLDVYKETKELIDENTAIEPASLYGHSKLYCEKMILAWAEQEKLVAQILRIGHIYGPGEEAYLKFIPVAIKSLLEGKRPVVYTNGMEKRSFLYISDCVQAIIRSISLQIHEGPINIVSSKAYSIAAIVQKIVDVSKKDIIPEFLNKDIPVKDFVFNTAKMNKYLPAFETELDAGLTAEYEAMKLIYSNSIASNG